MSEFSERINDMMNKRRITQKQLAEMANVTESAMSYYVNGARTPRIPVLSRLAGVLGVTTDYLLGAERPEPENESTYQFLLRNLRKLHPEQLEKAAQILCIVFADEFDEKVVSPAKTALHSETDFLYAEGNPGAGRPFVIRSFVEIADINESGILFTDGFRVDFAECANNCKSLGKACVAGRDSFADPPYMKFLTSGQPTRILFCSSSSFFFKKQKNQEMFRQCQQKIESFGFCTYDLA